MSIFWGNPIIVTSGTNNALLAESSGLPGGRFKVKQVQWLQPTLESTSGLLITKYQTGTSGVYLHLQAEVSGQSQVLRVDQWWNSPFINCVPTGELQIYLW